MPVPHAFDWQPYRAFTAVGLPILTAHNFGWFAALQDRVGANGHRVLLTGEDGNFSLGWPGRNLLHRLVAGGHWLRAAREVAATRRVTGRPLWQTVRQSIVAPFVPAALRRARRSWSGIGAGLEHYTFLAPAFAREHRTIERIEEIGGWRADLRWGDTFAGRAHWLIDGNDLVRGLKAQLLAFHGIEMRAPLGDARLVEFCLNVPEEHFMRDGRPRALQRDVIADRVPPEIYASYKHGEQAPEWFDRLTARRGAILADIEKIAQSPLASRAVDVDALRAAARHWPTDAQSARGADAKFRYGFASAVHLGNFICWFEGGNR